MNPFLLQVPGELLPLGVTLLILGMRASREIKGVRLDTYEREPSFPELFDGVLDENGVERPRFRPHGPHGDEESVKVLKRYSGTEHESGLWYCC